MRHIWKVLSDVYGTKFTCRPKTKLTILAAFFFHWSELFGRDKSFGQNRPVRRKEQLESLLTSCALVWFYLNIILTCLYTTLWNLKCSSPMCCHWDVRESNTKIYPTSTMASKSFTCKQTKRYVKITDAACTVPSDTMYVNILMYRKRAWQNSWAFSPTSFGPLRLLWLVRKNVG